MAREGVVTIPAMREDRAKPVLRVALHGMLDLVGLKGLAEQFKEWGALQAVERLNLDGLLALWHPPSSN